MASSKISQKVEQGKTAFKDFKEVKAAQSALREVGLKLCAKNISPAELQSLSRNSRLPDSSHPVYHTNKFKTCHGNYRPTMTTPAKLRTRCYGKLEDWKIASTSGWAPSTREYGMWVELGEEFMWHALKCFHPGSLDLYVDLAKWAVEHPPFLSQGYGQAEKKDLEERMLAGWLKGREIGFMGGWDAGGNSREESWKREVEMEWEREMKD